MDSCEKNCSCKRCNVPGIGVIKAIDKCNIHPVSTSQMTVVENFVYNIQEGTANSDFLTLTLPPITLKGNEKVRLEASSQVGALSTSGSANYIEDFYLTLQRNALSINVESRIFNSVVKIDPLFSEYFTTPITLLYVDNPGPGIYTYSVNVRNQSVNAMNPFILSTIITATIYDA